MTDTHREEEGPAHTARPAAEIRLRARRPPVTRLSRKILLGLGAAAAIAIGGALLFALRPQQHTNGTELLNTNNHNTPDGLASLPHDYSELPKSVPKLGPPLPGDLGKPILDAGAPAPGMSGPAEQHLAQEADAARTSRLFATTNVTSRSAPPQPAQQTALAAPSPASSASGPTPQDEKLTFLNGNVDRRTASPDRVQPPASPHVLQAGSVIPAALITGLRSDLPGEVTAQVTEDVYDSPTGKTLLIPQGTRLIGEYDAQVSFGQSRALLVWTRLIMPNGTSIVLERQPGVDTAGYAGLEDQVDNHWGMLFKAAILSTILSVGAEAGTSNSENNLAQAIRSGASQSINQAGDRVVGRSLNVQPTITIRPGFPVRVLVTRDLVLEPYRG